MPNNVLDLTKGERAVKFADSAAVDPLARLRLSLPELEFDSSFTYDAQSFLWTEATTGSGATTTYDADARAVSLGVSGATAGTLVRQTKRRFNVGAGNGVLCYFGAKLGNPTPGITRRIGYFDDRNGIYFETTGTDWNVVLRSDASGSVVEIRDPQSTWGIDQLDITGPSRIDIDLDKVQTFVLDIGWAGAGRARLGLLIDGTHHYCEEFRAGNKYLFPFIASPNLPLRLEIINDGTGDAAELSHYTSAVINENDGRAGVGRNFYDGTGTTVVPIPEALTEYPVLALRFEATRLESIVELLEAIFFVYTSHHVVWRLQVNPTLSGVLSYAPVAGASVEIAVCDGTQNVTSTGRVVGGGVVSTTNQRDSVDLRDNRDMYVLGQELDGTRDVLVITAEVFGSDSVDPLDTTTFAQVACMLKWKELI